MSAPIRVLLVDDHPAILAGLRAILGSAADVAVVGAAATLAQAETLLESCQPDVIVLDYELGNDVGLELLTAPTLLAPGAARPAIVLLSAHDNSAYMYQAHQRGTAGYILKEAALDVVLAGVRQVARGNTLWTPAQLARIRTWEEQVKSRWDTLTDRERDVLQAVAQGKSNREIAADLQITERTAESHVTHILDKLGVSSRMAAAAWVRDAGLERSMF